MKMFLFLGLLILAPYLAFASDIAQQQSTLYPFRTTIELQDEFTSGSTGNGTTGNLGFGTANGTTTGQASVANRIGIIRRDTSAVSGTIAVIFLNSTTSTAINPANVHRVVWVDRLNTNDANTTVRIGSINSVTVSPPAEGIFLEKLDADTNWFCVTRAAGVQTRTDSTIAVTTNFAIFSYTANSSGVQFSIDNVNVCGLQTTNIPTVFINPATQIVNSAAASKTIDMDYFQLQIFGLGR